MPSIVLKLELSGYQKRIPTYQLCRVQYFVVYPAVQDKRRVSEINCSQPLLKFCTRGDRVCQTAGGPGDSGVPRSFPRKLLPQLH